MASRVLEEFFQNTLEYWKINELPFPTLAKVAIKYLAVPVSSAPVDLERISSLAGKSLRPAWSLQNVRLDFKQIDDV